MHHRLATLCCASRVCSESTCMNFLSHSDKDFLRQSIVGILAVSGIFVLGDYISIKLSEYDNEYFCSRYERIRESHLFDRALEGATDWILVLHSTDPNSPGQKLRKNGYESLSEEEIASLELAFALQADLDLQTACGY